MPVPHLTPDSPAVSPGWRALPRSFFHLTGPDAERYLSGQITQGLGRLQKDEALPGFLLTVKGKIEAEIYVRRWNEGLLVDGEPDQRDFLEARLGKYLIADDAEITDVTDSLSLIHLVGSPPEEESAHRANRCGIPGFDLIFPSESAAKGRDNPREIEEAEWTRLRFDHGIPGPAELAPGPFPAETGLESTHVDFHKGCYLGQEIVSRMKKAGRVNRSLTVISSPLEQPAPQAGDILDDESAVIQTVTSSCEWPARSQRLSFAYCKPSKNA